MGTGNTVIAPQKLWTRHYVFMLIYGTLMGIGNTMTMTGIPLYAIHIGGDNSTAGLMMGVFMIAAILVRPFFGSLADKKSRRLVLLIGSGITTACFFSYMFVFTMGVLLFLRAVNGIGFSAETNASGTVLADIIPGSRLGEGIGNFGISGVVATAVGSPLALALIRRPGYPSLFVVSTAFVLGSLACAYFLNYEESHPRMPSPGRQDRKGLGSLFEKAALPPSFVMLFIAFAMGGQAFVPICAAERNVENVGLYFVFYAAALFVARLFGGRTADRYGAPTVLVPGYVCQLVSFAVLALASNLTTFVVAGFVYGLGMGLVEPLLNAVMVQFCPPDNRGAGSSTYYTAMDLGSGAGPVVWGFLSLRWGFTWVYLLCGASVGLSLVAYYRLLHDGLMKRQIDPQPASD